MEYCEQSSGVSNVAGSPSQGVCYHRYFEYEAEKRPDAVAVISENVQLTYEELNYRANRIAYQLINRGIGPEIPVGVYLERSIELVTAVVAIAKAGGVIVPLDPEHPDRYTKSVVRQTGLQVVMMMTRSLSEFPAGNLDYVCVDARNRDDSGREPGNPVTCLNLDNMFGIFFTSGSTGLPKGVMITYRSSMSRFGLIRELGLLGNKVRHLVQSPVSVGPLTGSIFYSLATGGKLVLAKPGGERDGVYLSDLLSSHHITAVNSSPAMIRHLLKDEAFVRESKLRSIVTSGEKFPESLQKRFQTIGNIDLYKLYGLTEAATVTYCKYQPDQDPSSVGYPAYSPVYILDDRLKKVPRGMVGDVYVSGSGLARGYLNNPALTATHFIANSVDEDGSRLFRTGDRGRWNEDGTLSLVGRSDGQIKVHGFRVEVGELESVLEQFAEVESAVVVADDTGSTVRLVAYVVTEAAEPVRADTLRQYMQERLPDYMMPVLFKFLEKMPVLANGKVDRKSLLATCGAGPDLEEKYVAPRTPVEEILVDVWSGLLGLEQVGVQDNFFTLGGHSLLATQLVSRLEAETGVRLPLNRIFESPTVGELALDITEGMTQVQ